MILAVAADHAGYEYKNAVIAELERLGHQALDLGTQGPAPVDYPDFAEAVAEAVRSGRAERGVLVCGSAVGVSVAANKFPGIRAGVCHDTYSAHQSVEHDDVNILCLGQRVLGIELVLEIVRTFVAARFSGAERHRRRLSKIDAIEARYSRGSGVREGEGGDG